MARGPKPVITDAEGSRLAKLYADGMSISDAARAIGRSRSTVHVWLKRHGLWKGVPKLKDPDDWPRWPVAAAIAWEDLCHRYQQALDRRGINPVQDAPWSEQQKQADRTDEAWEMGALWLNNKTG